jgi:spore maturation protein CgeB
MGRELDAELVIEMKRSGAVLINSYSDSFTDRVTKKYSEEYNKSIPYFDLIFTPRDTDFVLYRQYGAKAVAKFWKGFDHTIISAHKTCPESFDFIFAGHMENDRCEDISYLVSKGPFRFSIYGDGWNKSRLANTYPSLEYNRYGSVYESTLIGLNYFSKVAADTQNSRLFEVPGSRTLLLTERTCDALNSFREDHEAIFFSTKEELLDKVDYYSRNRSASEGIASAGYERACREYTNEARVEQMLGNIKALLH